MFPWITLPKTNSHFAPENRPKPKRKGLYSNSNHQFSGAEMLVSGSVYRSILYDSKWCKVGTVTSYKWSYFTPLSRGEITPVTD